MKALLDTHTFLWWNLDAPQLSNRLQVYKLPDIHQDPFDRLLVAQSQLEALSLLTADQEMARYGVDIIW